ncbi:MAG: hypothetical protein M3P18_15850 [Actinomycetota bacterium]|nr:hypothetical protein [Actinomycetota bacterium]
MKRQSLTEAALFVAVMAVSAIIAFIVLSGQMGMTMTDLLTTKASPLR